MLIIYKEIYVLILDLILHHNHLYMLLETLVSIFLKIYNVADAPD